MAEKIFDIWHDNDIDLAHWIKNNTSLSKEKTKFNILLQPQDRKFAFVPTLIKNILYLDKPDVIITHNVYGLETPIVALEFMEHTPQGQHPKQRFCRIAAAAENYVPSAFILPEVKKQGRYTYGCTPDIFFGLHKLIDAHKVPALGFFWPHKDGVLLRDDRHVSAPKITGQIENLLKFVDVCIRSSIKGEGPTKLLDMSIIRDQVDFMRERAYSTKVTIDRYSTLSLLSTKELTKDLHKKYGLNTNNLPEYFLRREKCLVFSPQYEAKKSKISFRTDPYAGMLAFFDYCFSRIGMVRQRKYNLVFRPVGISYEVMEKMYKNYWKNKCPFGFEKLDNIPLMTLHLRKGCTYTKNKQLRIFGYLSDMMIFDDFVIYG